MDVTERVKSCRLPGAASRGDEEVEVAVKGQVAAAGVVDAAMVQNDCNCSRKSRSRRVCVSAPTVTSWNRSRSGSRNRTRNRNCLRIGGELNHHHRTTCDV